MGLSSATSEESFACSSVSSVENKIVKKSKKGKKKQSTGATTPAFGNECLDGLRGGQPDQPPTDSSHTDPKVQTPAVLPFPPGRVYSPRGIINHNLYCGLNSLIQALMVTPYFTLYLETKESTEAARPLSRALRSFLTRIWRIDNQSSQLSESIDPLEMEDAHVLMFNKRFASDYQHDAEEYYSYLMEKLYDESVSPSTGLSPIQHIFQGSYDNGQNFYSLLLDISGKDTRSVSHALQAHLSPEAANVGDSPRKFRELPPVLCVALSRTIFNEETFEIDRLNKRIEYGPNLFIKPSMMETKGQPEAQYSLFAVIKHIGNRATAGHYISYVKDPQQSSWHWINDHMETRATLTQVLTDSATECAYMLLYSRTINVTPSCGQNGTKKTKKKNKFSA